MNDEAVAGRENTVRNHDEWRARPMILAGLGVIAALIIQQLLDRNSRSGVLMPEPATWRIALAAAIGTGAMALGFGMERLRLSWSLIFAGIVGAVAGLILYWHGNPGWSAFEGWNNASLFLSIAIAVPLFQTARDEGHWRFPYAEVHGHAWTNVVLWFACWLFVGVVFLLAYLLAALFDLIGLNILTELLSKQWFGAGLAGAAFGGSLGMLRGRDRVVRLLQRVVTAVLGLLAPVLGVGLLIFLGALPFTGLSVLWEATKSATPTLLGCVIGALILANAVIGDGPGEEGGQASNPILRFGALALALAILPLAAIAAIATGMRIDQYGFTPDRLWALIFVVLASAYGVAYLAALARGRFEWAPFVRASNLKLAFIMSGVALFLATPILSFNAISVRDQVARLESGRISRGKFDWNALENKFGVVGRAAFIRLQASGNADIRRDALMSHDFAYREKQRMAEALEAQRHEFSRNVRVLPQGAVMPNGLRDAFVDYFGVGRTSCNHENPCTMMLRGDGLEGFLLEDGCLDKSLEERHMNMGRGIPGLDPSLPGLCLDALRFISIGGRWAHGEPSVAIATNSERMKAQAAYRAGKIEVRPVRRRQLFLNGVPIGRAFE